MNLQNLPVLDKMLNLSSLSYYRKNQEANIVGQVGNMRTAVLSKRWRF